MEKIVEKWEARAGVATWSPDVDCIGLPATVSLQPRMSRPGESRSGQHTFLRISSSFLEHRDKVSDKESFVIIANENLALKCINQSELNILVDSSEAAKNEESVKFQQIQKQLFEGLQDGEQTEADTSLVTWM